MNLNDVDINGIEVIEKSDHYIVKRFKNYFRLGTREANIIIDILNKNDEEFLLKKYNLTSNQFSDFLLALQNAGIIGEVKKEKKNFLFYKIPLMNPDRLLTKFNNLFLQNKLINTLLLSLITITIILGFIEFGFNFIDISSKFLKGFGFKEYFLFYLATIGTVFLHELGHAIVCKYNGGKVDEIGFLLIFFSPALYCDVSGIWTFNKKKPKIATLLAGIIVQLIMFSIMTLLYVNFYSGSYWLATFICWNLLMTISNIIPVIKLDGYWILSNVIDVPNLYEKSMKLALGIKKNVLFNEKELAKEKFIKWFGIFNIAFVFVSIIFGFAGIYYISTTLEGTFRYVAMTVEILMYTLTLILFSGFLYKIIKLKRLQAKGSTE